MVVTDVEAVDQSEMWWSWWKWRIEERSALSRLAAPASWSARRGRCFCVCNQYVGVRKGIGCMENKHHGS